MDLTLCLRVLGPLQGYPRARVVKRCIATWHSHSLTFCTAEAKRAAKAFDENSSDREALEERIAVCEAGGWLSTKLDSLATETFLQYMELLHEHIQHFPVALTVSVNVRLYKMQVTDTLQDKRLEMPAVSEKLDKLMSTLQFWCSDAGETCDGQPLVNVDSPSLRPVYESIVSQMEATGAIGMDDDDLAFMKLAEKTNRKRALQKRDSKESQSSQLSAEDKTEKTEERTPVEDLEAVLLFWHHCVVGHMLCVYTDICNYMCPDVCSLLAVSACLCLRVSSSVCLSLSLSLSLFLSPSLCLPLSVCRRLAS